MQETDHTSGVDSETAPIGGDTLAVAALAVSVVALAALWVVAGLLRLALPERRPQQFDLEGVPDWIVPRTPGRLPVRRQTGSPTYRPRTLVRPGRSPTYRPRTFLSWFALPLTATGMTVLMLVLAFVIRPLSRGEAKWLITVIPRKKDFLRLSHEGRARALGPMDALLWGMPAPMNLIFLYVVQGTYAVAAKRSASVSPVPIILGAAAALVWAALCIIALRRAIIDEAERLEEAGGDSESGRLRGA